MIQKLGKGVLVKLGLSDLFDKLQKAIVLRDKAQVKEQIEKFDPELKTFFAVNTQFSQQDKP